MKAIDPTAERLLLAARRLFSDRGYEGTSVRAITRRAKANLGAITYHFGSKEALYQRVLADLIEPMATGVIREATAPGPTLERVASIIAFYFHHLHQNPDLPRFMLQVLAEQGPLPKSLAEVQTRQRAAIVALVERGQREGDIRPGPAPVLAINIVSPPVWFGLARRILAQIGHINPDDPRIIEMALRHTSAVVCQGLARDPQGGTAA